MRRNIKVRSPTMVETGFPEHALDARNALVATAGTPAPMIERLSGEIRAIAAKPDLGQKLRNAGIDAQSSTPAKLRRFIEIEIAKWSGYIQAAGMVLK